MKSFISFIILYFILIAAVTLSSQQDSTSVEKSQTAKHTFNNSLLQ